MQIHLSLNTVKGLRAFLSALLLLAGWAVNQTAAAAVGAVKIDAISDGRGIDSRALQSIRSVVGTAIGTGVVDSFYVYSPRAGGPIPIEGGLSACAEKGFGATKRQFEAFLKRLAAITPRDGTSIALVRAASCSETPEPQACGGLGGLPCPSGQACVDDPRDNCDPAAGGNDCSGICKVDSGIVCTADVKQCPGGKYVSRVPPSCEFEACP
jgi:hypothetical protein